MRNKLCALISILLMMSLCAGLLSGCEAHEEDSRDTSASFARVDSDGTTHLTEMDTTDENLFIAQYRRENFSIYEHGLFHVFQCVPVSDAFLLRGELLTGPEITGDEIDAITPGLCMIDTMGRLSTDYSEACVLNGNYELELIGAGIDSAFLSYAEDGYDSDHIIARLNNDGTVTELFHPELNHGLLQALIGTDDRIYVFISFTENGKGMNCIQQYNLEGILLQSEAKEGTINRVLSYQNNVYIQDTVMPSSIDGGPPLTQVRMLIPEDLSLSPVASFDSGFLVACDEGSLYIADGTSVYRYSLQTQETALLFNAAELGLSTVNCIIPADGGDFIGYNPASLQMYFLHEELSTETVGRKQIVLGTTNAVRAYNNAIIAFNSSQSEYKIVIHDYSKYPDPELVLKTEIIAGNGPDILDMVNLSADVLKSGVLIDLLPYIDSDPEIDTEDFFPSVFENMKTDGKVLTAIPTYVIYSLVTREDSYPDGIDGIADFLEAVSRNGLHYQYLWSRESFLQCAFCSDTINYYTQTDVANILRFSADLLPDEEFNQQNGIYEHQKEIASGQQDIFIRRFGGTDSVIMEELALQKTLKPIGLPFSEKNTGLIIPIIELGILSSSEVKDGAWAFLRTMFLKDYQSKFGNMSYPLSQSAYAIAESKYQERWEEGYWVTVAFADRADEVFLDHALGLECARNTLTNPYGVYHYNGAVMDFVNAAAQEYYGGKTSAEEAAHIVMSKLKIYFAERD